MQDQAIVCTIGHFTAEIQVEKLEKLPGHQAQPTSSPGRDKYSFPTATRSTFWPKAGLVTWADARAPQFVPEPSFTNQDPAQLTL